jgi:hypothetical protein
MRQFISSWSQIYPCAVCAHHMRKFLAVSPPVVTDKRTISKWMCEMHNDVNTQLGRPTYDCDPEVVLRRWHPTYPSMDDFRIEDPAPVAASRSYTAPVGQTMGGLNLGRMRSGWGSTSDGSASTSGVANTSTDADDVLKRLKGCQAFCPEKRTAPQ